MAVKLEVFRVVRRKKKRNETMEALGSLASLFRWDGDGDGDGWGRRWAEGRGRGRHAMSRFVVALVCFVARLCTMTHCTACLPSPVAAEPPPPRSVCARKLFMYDNDFFSDLRDLNFTLDDETSPPTVDVDIDIAVPTVLRCF